METEALSHLARLSVSLPAELLAQLDALVAERGLPSRSQMIAFPPSAPMRQTEGSR